MTLLLKRTKQPVYQLDEKTTKQGYVTILKPFKAISRKGHWAEILTVRKDTLITAE